MEAISGQESSESSPSKKEALTRNLPSLQEHNSSKSESDSNLNNDDQGNRNVSYRQIFRFASKTDLLCIAVGCICSLLSGLMQPMVLTIGGLLVTDFLQEGEKIMNDEFYGNVRWKLYLLGTLGSSTFILTLIQTYLMKKGCHNLACAIREAFLSAILKQDGNWFDSRHSGKLTTLLNDNISRVEEGLGHNLGLLIRGTAMFLSAVTICFIISWQLTLILLPIGPLGAFTMGCMGKFTSAPLRKMNAANSEASCIFEESVMNVKTVASCNGQSHMVEKYFKNLEEGMRESRKYNFWVGLFSGITTFELYIILAFAFWYGITGYAKGAVRHPGDIQLIVSTIAFTAWMLGNLGPNLMMVLKAKKELAEVYDVINREPAIDSNEEGKSLEDVRGSITFEDVWFSYPTRTEPVLKGLSFSVEPGTSVAFVGHSGCGKSTTVRLITRFYECIGGTIKIDGIPIEDIRLKSLRKVIGVVSKEPCLFSGTILDNIIMGREDVSEEDAVEALKIACADRFVRKLKNGYHTLLGHGGVTLSGGQKQRIAIARAIATNPKILILDEATSALDTTSERIVQEALKEASFGRTCISIAHRLSTLKDVEEIFVFDSGKVVEHGSHEDLLSYNGLYTRLCNAQEINDDVHVEESEAKLSYTSSEIPTDIEKIECSDIPLPIHSHFRGFMLLYKNLGGHYCKLVQSMVVALVHGIEIPMVWLMYYFTFRALAVSKISGHERDMWMYLTIAVACCTAFLVLIGQTAQHVTSGNFAEHVVASLRTRMLNSLLHRPLYEFDRPDSSQATAVTVAANHGSSSKGGLDHNLSQTIKCCTAMVLALSLSVAACWQMSLLALGLCFISYGLVIYSIFSSNALKTKKDRKDKSGECSIEIIEQARTIQLLSCEEHFIEKYRTYQDNSKTFMTKIALLDSINFAGTESFPFFCDLAAYAFGSYLIYNGHYSADYVFLAIFGCSIAGWNIMSSGRTFPDMFRAYYSASKLFNFIDNEDVLRERIEYGATPEIRGSIDISNVIFTYPNGREAARVLCIQATSEESIALVGESGGGKSTAINLLSAFYYANEGKVYVDSHDIRDINLHHLRNNISLVSQEPVLFKGTIQENITLGFSSASPSDVIEACRKANAENFIKMLPQGYDTDVGEKGHSLSGGQKQRIAIARALVRNPKILLLDEATSALDTESEKIVQAALMEASQNRTTVTVAHRLSSIQHCSKIYVFSRGRVVESGNHQELCELGGRYWNMIRAQKL